MPEDFDVPLFDLPEPSRRRFLPPSPGLRATRYRSTRERVLCGDCVLAIHERGVERAPYPKTARWRVAGPGHEPRLLCEDHKIQRMEST